MGSKNRFLKDVPMNHKQIEKNHKSREDLISRTDLVSRRDLSRTDLISRRDFSSKLLKTGLGLAAAAVLPSFVYAGKKSLTDPGAYPEGRYLDVHHHLGRDLLTSADRFTFDPILKWMDENDVSQTVILSPIQYPGTRYPVVETETINNEELLERFEDTNDRLLPFCVVHPDAFDSSREITKILKRCRKKGVVGFGELKPRDKNGKAGILSLDDPSMKRLYAACSDVGFPVLLHIDDKHAVDEVGLPAMERVLKEFPEVDFIGHANGWWNSISGDVTALKGYDKGKVTEGGAAVRLLEEYPNMYADLSANSGLNAITRDPEFGMNFLKTHSDKLMFGTDAQGGTGRESHFEFFDEADLSQDEKLKIFGENARTLLNI